MNKNCKIGDVVRLKSGGPKMTIINIIGNLAECRWFEDGENKVDSNFELVALEKVRKHWLF